MRLLGSKADREVIDSIASERNKFLKEVNSKMNDVENQVPLLVPRIDHLVATWEDGEHDCMHGAGM